MELEQLDVADDASIVAFAKRVLDKHGRVDILGAHFIVDSPVLTQGSEQCRYRSSARLGQVLPRDQAGAHQRRHAGALR